MAREPDEQTLRAERVLRESGQTQLPIDPFAIAKDVEISVFAKEATSGVSGTLIRVGDNFAISYAAHIASEGFQRFSVSHELGHYFLDGHVDHVLGPNGIHESRAEHMSADHFEREADRFAAALLMPFAPFTSAALTVGDGLCGIEELASLCRTSLTATAIRYVECAADEPIAVVLTKMEEIQFCAMSERFKKLPGITWRRKGDRVPSRSAGYRLALDPPRIRDAEREDGDVHLHDWFDQGPDLRLAEEAIGLGRSGQILTVLSIEKFTDDSDAEDEAALVESWTPRFRR